MRRILVCILWVMGNWAWGQVPYSYIDSIPVSIGGSTLSSAWCGGIHAPQFSSVHLNGDNLTDLMVFDQSGSRVRTFLYEGQAGTNQYTFQRSAASHFPDELNQFVLLEDYNCDGAKDLFTYDNGVLQVYRNDGGTAGGPQFTLVADPLWEDEGGLQVPIITRPLTLPAIADIDGDGDLDILTLSKGALASRIYYHRNVSMENYGHCDSLEYILEDFCWGKYDDASLSTNPQLGISCRIGRPGEGIGQIEPGKTNHPSGTNLLALDLDGDGDKEILHANYPSPNTFMLRNGGSPSNALMDSVQVFFPETDTSIHIDAYPGSYLADIDNDGNRDLLVAPFVVWNDRTNLQQSWYYRNEGTDNQPDFKLQDKGFLVKDMIDVGAKSHPAMFDAEGDGDLDLVVGNFAIEDTAGVLYFFRNQGTVNAPAFVLEDTNYMDIYQLFAKDLVPAFGDLDLDGDADLVLGDQDGNVYILENQPQGGEASFVLPAAPSLPTAVIANAAPTITDINGDNVPDLLVGRLNGEISYFPNLATAGSYQFSLSSGQALWGGVDVTPLCCVGNSVPVVFDHQGDRYLLVSSDQQKIYVYHQISVVDTLVLLDSMEVQGDYLSITAGDLNGDGDQELVMGNQAGGLEVIEFDKLVNAAPKEDVVNLKWSVWPNPAKGVCSVELREPVGGKLELWSPLGQRLAVYPVQPGITRLPNIKYPAGMYLLRLDIRGQKAWKRLLLR